MTALRRFIMRLVSHFRRNRAERELLREVQAHLHLIEDELIASGMSAADARAVARSRFGGVEQAKELQRDARSFRWLTGWSMDLRLGVRMLIKSPGLTVIAVVALTVAIGGGAAYLEFVNDFFRPTLSIPGGDRLVGLVHIDPASGGPETRALHQFSQWAPRLTRVRHLGFTRELEQNLVTADGASEPVRIAEISASIFLAVPIPPLAGRHLTEADERPGAPAVVLLGEDLWRQRFGADPTLPGRTILLGGTAATIAGVMPSSFAFPINSNVWTPARLRPETFASAQGPSIRIFGQLVPGASLADAQAELSGVVHSIANDRQRPTTAVVKPYVESIWTASNLVMQVRLLYGTNLFSLALLALCAANVATLVFARTASREAEIAVRTALGAGRGRIVAQLVAEALVLTSVAAALGFAGATLGLRKVREIAVAAQNEPMPFWWNEQLGVETLLYGLVLVVIASLIIGGIPALKATGVTLQLRLKDAGATGGTMQFGKWWTTVIVSQVAVTVVCLIAVAAVALAGVSMAQSFSALGLPQQEYLTAYVEMREDVPPARRKQLLADLQHQLSRDSGVVNSTYVNRVWNHPEFWLEFADPSVAASARPPGDILWVKGARVGPDYFETFGQRLIAGRRFLAAEIESGAPVAVVDDTFVRRILGGRNALGIQVRRPPTDTIPEPGPWLEIVGVVRDLSNAGEKTTEDATLYQPMNVGADTLTRVVVHSRASDAGARLRAAAEAVDPQMKLAEVMSLERFIDTEVQTFRFLSMLVGIVAAVALLLSTASIYALISFTLSRREKEIGIRTALGAAPGQVVSAVLGRALKQVGIGILIGSVPGYFVGGLDLEGAGFFGAWTPFVTTLTTILFRIVVTTLACIVPIRRALNLQPTEALRRP